MGIDKVPLLKIDRDCFVDGDWMRNYTRVIVATCKMFGLTVESIRVSRSKRKGWFT